MSRPHVAVSCVLVLFATAARVSAQTGNGRVDSLIKAMTLDEKVSFLHGARDPKGEAGAGYIPGVPRLGIPPLRLTDGPAGVRTAQPATALPAPVMLSATFDPEMARRFGAVMGVEGRARDHDVLLAPMVNIVRVPTGGRDFETLGEDPLLAARMVAAEVEGIEAQGLMATVKHYVANNFERDRFTIDEAIDERTLNEIYLPGFEAGVKAGAASVMCAYNQVNGAPACDSPVLLNDVLRTRFGFAGWVMTDWGAVHGVNALGAGLDQEMPGTGSGGRQRVYFRDSLPQMVRDGRVPEAMVDRAVRRILVQMDRMQLLDGVPPRPPIDVDVDAETARDVALAGAVLLRNERATLPLTRDDVASLVAIGPTGKALLYGGGGSSEVIAFHNESPIAALERQAGAGATVRYVPGIDLDGATVPAAALAPAGQGAARGLLRIAPDSSSRVDTVIDYTGASALPSGTRWAWRGTITAPATGAYDLKLQTRGGSGALSLDGERVLSSGGFGGASALPTSDGLTSATTTIPLTAGEAHEVAITCAGRGDRPLEIRFAWVTPDRRQRFLDDAAAAARAAHAALVFVSDPSTEGRDRASLALPGAQDALVAAVAAANPRTTVVLNTGAPVLMPWLDQTGAVLEMWYPGQEGGDATAALLLGQANPAGKLPVTFPHTEVQTPLGGFTERYPGVDGRAIYSEGILVGYRWYDAEDVAPLFPFGHGLSYTRFAYSDLAIAPRDDGFDVIFRVRNTGAVSGTEVPQVYLGPPDHPPVPMEPKKLVGFTRITLGAGEERAVTIHVGQRERSYWSTTTHDWAILPGSRPVWVGSSSRDIRLRGQSTD